MGYRKGSSKLNRVQIIGLHTKVTFPVSCCKCGKEYEIACYDNQFVCDVCKEQEHNKQHIEIVSRRATCKGIQYTVADWLGTEIVTVNNGCIACTCGLDRYFLTCQHILTVEKQERAYAEEANKRASYEATFDVSYGC